MHEQSPAHNAPQPLRSARPDQMLTQPIYCLISITSAVEKIRSSYFPPHFVMRATRSKRLFVFNDVVAGGRQSNSPVDTQIRFKPANAGIPSQYRPCAAVPSRQCIWNGRFTGELAQALGAGGQANTGTRFGKAVHAARPETGGGGPRSSTARVGVTLYSRDNGIPNANRTARAAVP